jgi:hypothetical protein
LISGAPRSGTTLLRKLVSLHPSAGILHEHGLGRLFRTLEDLGAESDLIRPERASATAPALQEDLARRIDAARDVTHATMDDLPIGFSGKSFDTLAKAAFGAAFPGKQLQVVGDKEPVVGRWQDSEALLERAPNLKFVFILRNPLDVISSSMGRRLLTSQGLDFWHVNTVQEACAEYANAWRRMQAVRREHPNRVCLLKYEDLCRRTAAEMARVFAFLGLEPHHVPDARAKTPGQRPFLSPNEVNEVRTAFPRLIEQWGTGSPDELLELQLAGEYRFGDRLDLTDPRAELNVEIGLPAAEAFGRWTEGGHARISLRHTPTSQPGLLELFVAQAYRVPQEPFDLMVSVNGGEPKHFEIETVPTRLSIALKPGELVREVTDVDLFPVRPKTPEEAPVEDLRELGVALSGIRITPYAWPYTLSVEGAKPEPAAAAAPRLVQKAR